MSKSKTNVQILTGTGITWTTKRGAIRICARGLAEYVSPKLIRMISGHQPHLQSPGLPAVVTRPPVFYAAWDGMAQTFLPYPQRDTTTYIDT